MVMEEPVEEDPIMTHDICKEVPLRLDHSQGPISRIRANYWFIYPTLEQTLSMSLGRIIILTGPPPSLQKQIYHVQELTIVEDPEDMECTVFWAFPMSERSAPLALIVALHPYCPPSPSIMAMLGTIGVGSATAPAILPVSKFEFPASYADVGVQTTPPTLGD